MDNGISIDEMKQEVRKIIAEIAEIPEADIKDESLFFEELGIDSMMALEIVTAIEKRYRIHLPEEQIPNIRSISKVCELLKGLLTASTQNA